MDIVLPAAPLKRSSIGIVIGSGGIRSLAALPILEFLKQIDVKVDLLAGCGGGGILAALHAVGFSSKEIPLLMSSVFERKLFSSVNYRMLFEFLGLITRNSEIASTLLRGDRLQKRLEKIFGKIRQEHLSQKIMIQATNLNTGSAVVLTEGILADNLYASNAIYPFMPSIKIDGNQLTAGLFTGTLPVLSAAQSSIDTIIAIGANSESTVEAKGFIECMSNFMNRSFSYNQSRQITLAVNFCDREFIFMNPVFPKQIGLWDIKYVNEILNSGKMTVDRYRYLLNELAKP